MNIWEIGLRAVAGSAGWTPIPQWGFMTRKELYPPGELAAKAAIYATAGIATYAIAPYLVATGAVGGAAAGAAAGGVGTGAVVGGSTLGAVALTALPQAIKTGGQVGIAALTLDYMQKNPLVVLGIAAAVIGFLVLRRKK